MKVTLLMTWKHLKRDRHLMRYELQIKSKTFELTFTLLSLLMALLFSENEIFWRKKSWRNSYLFYLLELSVLATWVYSFCLQLLHVSKKYTEIIRRRDHADDESIPAYGIASGLQRSSVDGILTLGDTSDDKNSRELKTENSTGLANQKNHPNSN